MTELCSICQQIALPGKPHKLCLNKDERDKLIQNLIKLQDELKAVAPVIEAFSQRREDDN